MNTHWGSDPERPPDMFKFQVVASWAQLNGLQQKKRAVQILETL